MEESHMEQKETKTIETKTIETSYDDLQLETLKLEKLPELCKNYKPADEKGLIEIEVANLKQLLNKKQDLLDDLRKAVETETRLTLEYNHKFNDATLHCNFAEVLDKSRPTKDDKEAHIIETNKESYDAMKIAEENTIMIKKYLDMIDNRISLEKTIIRLRENI